MNYANSTHTRACLQHSIFQLLGKEKVTVCQNSSWHSSMKQNTAVTAFVTCVWTSS